MKLRDNETIAAIATPVGEGAIAVIRLSGSQAVEIADRVFVGRKKLSEVAANTVHFGKVVDTVGGVIDEVLATVFLSPHSYTGEDSVEISCHGGVFVANRILDALLSAGARLADPGEFTKRAFLSGRIDLSQAEAVSDLIQARSEKAHWVSMGQLEGKLSGFVGTLKSDLLRLCALLELELDFSEEGLPLVQKTDVRAQLLRVRSSIGELIGSYRLGRHYRDGVLVVLVGKPNSGKSSIFNALLKERRAIVSPSPGTTRDYIEEAVVLGGVLFRLVDTAGLRDTSESVEAEGVERAKSILARGDIVIAVVDFSEPHSRADALRSVAGFGPNQELIVAYNKIDLTPDQPATSLDFENGGTRGREIFMSAKTGAGLDILTDVLSGSVKEDSCAGFSDFRVTSRRHLLSCEHADHSLGSALESLQAGMTNEFIAFDIKQAVDALSEITGEVTSEDILNEIFSRFCIGK